MFIFMFWFICMKYLCISCKCLIVWSICVSSLLNHYIYINAYFPLRLHQKSTTFIFPICAPLNHLYWVIKIFSRQSVHNAIYQNCEFVAPGLRVHAPGQDHNGNIVKMYPILENILLHSHIYLRKTGCMGIMSIKSSIEIVKVRINGLATGSGYTVQPIGHILKTCKILQYFL